MSCPSSPPRPREAPAAAMPWPRSDQPIYNARSMSFVLIHSDRFVEHQTPPGHPERPERAEVMSDAARGWAARGIELAEPPAASHQQLARVHDPAYVEFIASTRGRAAALDPDTFTSPESYEIARFAAGAAVAAVDRVLADGDDARAFALVRP